MAGCSGYVQFRISGIILTIAFSNPSVGNNKVGVGMSGKMVILNILPFHQIDKIKFDIFIEI